MFWGFAFAVVVCVLVVKLWFWAGISQDFFGIWQVSWISLSWVVCVWLLWRLGLFLLVQVWVWLICVFWILSLLSLSLVGLKFVWYKQIFFGVWFWETSFGCWTDRDFACLNVAFFDGCVVYWFGFWVWVLVDLLNFG